MLVALFTGACAHITAPAAAGPELEISVNLPTVIVTTDREHANGPVDGYRATRSSTFTKTDVALKDVPATVTVVSKDLMRDIAAQSMADLLRYVPGATAHQGEGNRDQVVLRGNSTSADFYADGVRDDAQVFRDPYNLERVEILKGPGGMAFGRGGAGGVVNRVTKQASFQPINELALSIGGEQSRRLTADVGGTFSKDFAWRVNAVAEDDGSFRQGVTTKREAINPALAWHLGADTQLSINAEHLRDSRTADRGVPSRNGLPIDSDVGQFFGNAAQSHATSTVDAFNAAMTHRLSDAWAWKSALRIAHYDKFYQNIYPASAVQPNQTITLSAYNNANQRTNTFWQNDFTGRVPAGTWTHHLLVGVEVGRQDSASHRNTGFFGAAGTATSATVSTLDPFATATRFAQLASDVNSQADASIAAVTLQDMLELNTQWKLLVGARVDRFTLKVDDRRTVTTPTNLSRTDTGLSPRLGVIWSVTPATTTYLSVSESFLPSTETLSLATTTADLAPERARNLEAGVKADLGEDLAFTAAAFRLDRRDVRSADPTRAGFFVKTGLQRTDGIELGLQGKVTEQWQLFAGAAWIEGRVKTPLNSGTTATIASIIPAGRETGLTPHFAASIWNQFRFDQHWSAGLGLATQSRSYTSFTNAVALPKFTRGDASLSYAFDDHKTQLTLNVENIANVRYAPTADGDNNISVGSPRMAKLTLRTRF